MASAKTESSQSDRFVQPWANDKTVTIFQGEATVPRSNQASAEERLRLILKETEEQGLLRLDQWIRRILSVFTKENTELRTLLHTLAHVRSSIHQNFSLLSQEALDPHAIPEKLPPEQLYMVMEIQALTCLIPDLEQEVRTVIEHFGGRVLMTETTPDPVASSPDFASKSTELPCNNAQIVSAAPSFVR